MDTDDIDPMILIHEVEALIHAACHATDHERYETLMRWGKEILRPLVEARMPQALWLSASFIGVESEQITSDAFDHAYFERIREAVDAGNADAQFRLACELDHEPTLIESAGYFERAAAQGHAYATWCHGLNLVSGRGITQDREHGLSLIRRAADLQFEGAVKFLADAYAAGTHGFPKNEQESARWWKELSKKDLIRY